jgi:adenylate kinase
MRVLMFGPPGAGKGTQANLLVRRFQLKHISTGNILRQVIDEGSDTGAIAKKYMDKGKLVPNELIRDLAEEAIAEANYDRFILDGYPRTVEQAKWLSEFLERHEFDLDVIVSLKVPDEVIVGRLSQRRVNKLTGENYHLEFKPPSHDVDPALIIQRRDDRPDAIRKRLSVYHKQTKPVEDFYVNDPNYLRIDGTQSQEVVHRLIADRLEASEEKQRAMHAEKSQ